MEQQLYFIRRLLLISLVVNALLALEKLFFALQAHSISLLGDGIDSLADVVISSVLMVTSRFAAMPADERHPWGHGRLNAVMSKVLAFVMFSAGFELVRTSWLKLLTGTNSIVFGFWPLAAAGLSLVGKFFLFCYLRRGYRQTGHSLLRAMSSNLGNDVLLSLGVLSGLLVSGLSPFKWFDVAAGLLIGLLIIYSAIKLFIETSQEMMDSVDDPELYRRLFAAVDATPPLRNPHRARIRKIGQQYDIVVDVEAPGHLSLFQVHRLSEQLERKMRDQQDDLFDIVVHIEPEDHPEQGEGFGLEPNSIDKM